MPTDYNSLQQQLSQANSDASNAYNQYAAYNSGQPMFASMLYSALKDKFNNNQDLIGDKNSAMNSFLNAANNANIQGAQNLSSIANKNGGQGVVNPYALQAYTQNAVNNAYTNYNNYNDLYNQRIGSLKDLVDMGQGLYNSAQNAAQGTYQAAQNKQQNLSQQASLAIQKEQADAMSRMYSAMGAAYAQPQTAQPGFDQYWNAYQQYLTQNKLSNKTPGEIQDNLYQYLNHGPGAGITDPTVLSQMWAKWNELNNSYKAGLTSKLQAINQIKPSAYSGPTFQGLFNDFWQKGPAVDTALRGFFEIPQNRGWI